MFLSFAGIVYSNLSYNFIPELLPKYDYLIKSKYEKFLSKSQKN
jgi:hypothetical protein